MNTEKINNYNILVNTGNVKGWSTSRLGTKTTLKKKEGNNQISSKSNKNQNLNINYSKALMNSFKKSISQDKSSSKGKKTKNILGGKMVSGIEKYNKTSSCKPQKQNQNIYSTNQSNMTNNNLNSSFQMKKLLTFSKIQNIIKNNNIINTNDISINFINNNNISNINNFNTNTNFDIFLKNKINKIHEKSLLSSNYNLNGNKNNKSCQLNSSSNSIPKNKFFDNSFNINNINNKKVKQKSSANINAYEDSLNFAESKSKPNAISPRIECNKYKKEYFNYLNNVNNVNVNSNNFPFEDISYMKNKSDIHQITLQINNSVSGNNSIRYINTPKNISQNKLLKHKLLNLNKQSMNKYFTNTNNHVNMSSRHHANNLNSSNINLHSKVNSNLNKEKPLSNNINNNININSNNINNINNLSNTGNNKNNIFDYNYNYNSPGICGSNNNLVFNKYGKQICNISFTNLNNKLKNIKFWNYCNNKKTANNKEKIKNIYNSQKTSKEKIIKNISNNGYGNGYNYPFGGHNYCYGSGNSGPISNGKSAKGSKEKIKKNLNTSTKNSTEKDKNKYSSNRISILNNVNESNGSSKEKKLKSSSSRDTERKKEKNLKKIVSANNNSSKKINELMYNNFIIKLKEKEKEKEKDSHDNHDFINHQNQEQKEQKLLQNLNPSQNLNIQNPNSSMKNIFSFSKLSKQQKKVNSNILNDTKIKISNLKNYKTSANNISSLNLKTPKLSEFRESELINRKIKQKIAKKIRKGESNSCIQTLNKLDDNNISYNFIKNNKISLKEINRKLITSIYSPKKFSSKFFLNKNEKNSLYSNCISSNSHHSSNQNFILNNINDENLNDNLSSYRCTSKTAKKINNFSKINLESIKKNEKIIKDREKDKEKINTCTKENHDKEKDKDKDKDKKTKKINKINSKETESVECMNTERIVSKRNKNNKGENSITKSITTMQSCIKDCNYYQKEMDRVINSIKQYYLINKSYPESKLNFYKYGRLVGKGAFGKVNLALHLCSGKLVAIKSLNKSKIQSAKDLSKIMLEIDILKKFHHPFITHLLDTFENETHIFIVMEYTCDDLLNYISKRSKLSENVAKVLFKQIIEGLKYIHSKNIVHRDIKLDNILIDLTNTIKICDFGVSKVINSNEIMHERCGTPAYIAPEIYEDAGYKGFSCDIWSAGVTLYYMLSGKQPFEGSNLSTLHYEILNQEIEPIENISKEAQDLINGMLKINPEERLTIKEILRHPWISRVDLDKRGELNLFTKSEKINFSKFDVNYLVDDYENLIENFTLKNINTINDVDKLNTKTKSQILAPYNSFDVSGSNDSLFDSIVPENNRIKFGGYVIQSNLKYELNNNEDFDNGIIITKESREEDEEDSDLCINSQLLDIEDSLNTNRVKFNENLNGYYKYNKKILKDIEETIGYTQKYLIKCLNSNIPNYATSTYYLLEKSYP